MRHFGLILAALTLLTGCGTMKIDDFKGAEPTFTLEDYFAGESRAWGIFEDRFGNLRRQFTVEISGEWDAQTRTLTLVEDFGYRDGETERRVWTLEKIGDNRYRGTAPGVVGTAQGEIAGNAFHWTYTYDLPIGDSTWRVDFDDWMFLQPDGMVINRAVVSKWGLEIGRATIVFRKGSEPLGAEAARDADANAKAEPAASGPTIGNTRGGARLAAE